MSKKISFQPNISENGLVGVGKIFKTQIMRRIKTTLLLLVLLVGLIPAISTAQCIASFSMSVSGSTVTFTNNSSNYNSIGWTYGDSTSSNTFAQTHSHTYASSGTYLICLTVSDTSNSCVNTYCDTISVTVSSGGGGCGADFGYSTSGLTASFIDSSYASFGYSTFWTFGDGNTSSGYFPSHTYSSSGTYTVCLIITDTVNNCTDSICKSVTVSGSSGSTCNANFSYTTTGTAASFTNTSSNNVYNTWYFGDGSSSQATNPSHTYSSSGTYTVCLIIQDSLQTCVDSICKSVTVSTPSSCQAAFMYSISGSTVYFYDSSSTGGSSGINYSWSFGDNNGSSQKNPVHTYSNSGTYTVCLTIWDSLGLCSDTVCNTIQISAPSPCQASFTHTTSGLSASFFNSSTGTTPGTSYFWDFGNGKYAYNANPSHGYLVAGSYVVCLTITDSLNNCFSTYCDTVTVSGGGSGNCKASFTYQGSSLMYFFTNTSNPNNGAITWIWDMGDGTTLWNKNPVHTYQNPGTYVVCLTMYDSTNNCNNSFCDTLVVTSTSRCNASFNIVPDSLNPNNLTFVNTSSPQFGLTYQWIFSDGTVYGSRHVNRTFNTPGTYTVCLYITDSINQCQDSTCQTFTVTAPVTCDAKFTKSISGKTVNFMNQSVPNSFSVSYSWNFGDGSAGSSAKNPNHTYGSYGTYQVCLTIVDSLTNCWDTYCDTITLTAPAACVADFYVSDSNGIFIFSNLSTPANQLNYYLWSFGDGNTSNQAHPVHQYNAPGTYNVCLYVEDTLTGCSDSTCKTVTVAALNTDEVTLSASSVNVYPNPFDNQINISWSQSIDQVSIRLYDLTGKAMLLETALPAEKGLTHTLDLSSYSLSSGVYYLEIAAGQNKTTYPVYKR